MQDSNVATRGQSCSIKMWKPRFNKNESPTLLFYFLLQFSFFQWQHSSFFNMRKLVKLCKRHFKNALISVFSAHTYGFGFGFEFYVLNSVNIFFKVSLLCTLLLLYCCNWPPDSAAVTCTDLAQSQIRIVNWFQPTICSCDQSQLPHRNMQAHAVYQMLHSPPPRHFQIA